jgi:alpha/beta superfamily hydrolase
MNHSCYCQHIAKTVSIAFARTAAIIERSSQRKMISGMDSTIASAETDARYDRPVLQASQKTISPQERRGIRSVAIAGPAGQLEAVLNQGEPDARFSALICHPHPRWGGNLHNKVVYHAMKVLNDPALGFGCPVLRFNFRGAGLSEGEHDGVAENGDVLAGMDWLDREFRLPLIVAGFSFGAAMALRACCLPDTPRHDVRALIALGLPIAVAGSAYQYSYLQDSSPQNLTTPKLFLSGDRDQFASAEQLAQVAASAAEPRRLILIPGADHFFTDQLESMQHSLAGWLKEQLP